MTVTSWNTQGPPVFNVHRIGGHAAEMAAEFASFSTSINLQGGTATLVAGTKTVTGATLTANSVIKVSCNTPAGTPGFLSCPSATRNVGAGSFVINSTSATDTSTVDWLIFG